jgi:Xaa-Pro aminopeptidase
MNRDMVKACKITDKVFLEVVGKIESFSSERDISRFISRRFRELGAGLAFPSIVANNNSVIHPKPRGEKLSRGFCIIDMGARVNGMSADMTRTIFFGRAGAQEKKLYKMVLDTQEKCIKKVRAGMLASDLDAYARKYLGSYRKYFTHALGHGVGRKIHMNPKIIYRLRNGPNYDEIPSGGCIAIEPGIYIKKGKKEFGIRVEDTIYVGRTKIESLTKSPKRLIEVPL